METVIYAYAGAESAAHHTAGGAAIIVSNSGPGAITISGGALLNFPCYAGETITLNIGHFMDVTVASDGASYRLLAYSHELPQQSIVSIAAKYSGTVQFHAQNRENPIKDTTLKIDGGATDMGNQKDISSVTEIKGQTVKTGPDGKVTVSDLIKGVHKYYPSYDGWTGEEHSFEVTDTPATVEIAIPDMIAHVTLKDDKDNLLDGATVFVNDVEVGETIDGGKIDYYASRVLDDEGERIQFKFRAVYNGIPSDTVVSEIRCPVGADVALVCKLVGNITFHASNAKANNTGIKDVVIKIDGGAAK